MIPSEEIDKVFEENSEKTSTPPNYEQTPRIQYTKRQIPVISMSHFKEVETNDKLDLLMAVINTTNTNFHYKMESLERELTSTVKNVCEAIFPRVVSLQKSCEELQARVDNLESNLPDFRKVNTKLYEIDTMINPMLTDLQRRMELLEANQLMANDDVAVLKGFMQVQEKLSKANKDKIVDLTARSMSQNLLIYGLTPDAETQQETIDKVLTFLCSNVKMEVQDDEILVAHRIGKKGDKPRPMVVKCSHALMSRVFSYTKNLKNQKNDLGDSFVVKKQLPEPLATQRRERDEAIKNAKKSNESLPQDKQIKIEVKNQVLYLNKVPQKQFIAPPTVQDVFELEENAEYGAGKKMLQILLDKGLSNIAVFVSRKYGGMHLGPRRFMYIQKVTNEAIDNLQQSLT